MSPDPWNDPAARARFEEGKRMAAAIFERAAAEQRASMNGSRPAPASSWPGSTEAELERLVPAGRFVFDPQADAELPIVGRGEEVLHAAGEPTFVIGQTGVGKSTYGQSYVLHRLGLRTGSFLGYPVRPLGPGEVIFYVAADRPRQIRRSLRRMVTPEHAGVLDERLAIWRGPLPYLLNREPHRLLTHVRRLEAHLGRRVAEVILDSLKDVALELTKDEGGAGVAQALNSVVGDGRENLVLHHERKPEKGTAKKAPATVADVYGSQMLTACAGNVIYLHGPPGAHVVTLHHLKQSSEAVGPLELLHDHERGEFTVTSGPDLLAALRTSAGGLTVAAGCQLLYGTADVDRNDRAKVYRRLERYVRDGLARKAAGGEGFDQPALYMAVDARREGPE